MRLQIIVTDTDQNTDNMTQAYESKSSMVIRGL